MADRDDCLNVAFICDDNYALCTGVAISSLKRYRNLERNYRVFIVAKDVSTEHCALFEKLNAERFEVLIIDAEKVANYSNFSRTRYAQHVSESALYKFNLPDIFTDIDKLLYLDGDILIRDDLTALYDLDVSSVYAAVCQDIGAETYPSPYNQRLKIQHQSYFNTGVMLLNLENLRRDSIPAKLYDYKVNGINHYMDQDAFNVVFRENVVFFPFLYNMAVSAWYQYPVQVLNHYYSMNMPSKTSFFTEAKILHLTTPGKQWKYSNVIASEEWLAEYVASSFCCNIFQREKYSGTSIKDIIADEVDYYDLISERQTIISKVPSPKISVIIPVYNSEKYLADCVESLMCQSFHDAEFIFVDDGSTDRSVDVLKMYQRLDGRISIFQQKNSYAGVARNTGMSHATGEYITFLDSDDIMLPYALDTYYHQATAFNADVVVSSAYWFSEDVVERNLAEWCLRTKYLPMGKAVFSRRNYSNYLFQISAGAPWGKLYRRELIEKNGLSFPALPRSEDFCFVYEAFAVAESISTVDEKLILYRINENSGSLENTKDKSPTAFIDGYLILWNRLTKRNLNENLRQTFINALVHATVNNFYQLKTGTGYKKLFNSFREDVVTTFNLDFTDEDFYYEKDRLNYLKEIAYAENFDEYMYQKAKLRGTQSTFRNPYAIGKSNKTSDFYKNEIELIHASASYRIGRFITFIPRKLRGGIRCYQEHGWSYTWQRVLVHLGIKKDG